MKQGALKRSGFSLIELLIVIAIASMLVVFSVPSLRDSLVRTSKNHGFEEVLKKQVELAISTARTNQAQTTVCTSVGNGCVVSGEWAQGILVEAQNVAANKEKHYIEIDFSGYVQVDAFRGNNEIDALDVSTEGLLSHTTLFCVKPTQGSSIAPYAFQLLRTGSTKEVPHASPCPGGN